jgi:hypothetical protein
VIVRGADGRVLVDCEAIFEQLRRTAAMQTIRARCTPVGKDEASGRWLYDLEEALDAMDGVRPRRPHRRGQNRRST